MKKVILLFLIIIVFLPHNMPSELSEDEIADIIIEKKKLPYDLVTVTTYTISEGQTDSTPLITASGYKLDSINPKKQRVRVKGAGKLDGVYTVRDLMAKRWTKKIDILINPEDIGTKLRKVKLYNIKADLDN
jgi:3D (Asp-Asp-Asp) domain-containing protein